MSRQITPLSIIVLVTIGFAFGVLTMVISNIQRGESLHKSYERGYFGGYLHGSYRVTEIFDGRNNYADGLLDAWEHGMRECLGDDMVDEFLAEILDSTDTMPAVDLRRHPKAVWVPPETFQDQYPGYPKPAVKRDTLTSRQGLYLLNTD